MPRLIAALIRHGDYRKLPDTPSAHQPFPLNAEGEAQAAEKLVKAAHILNEAPQSLQRWKRSSRFLHHS